MLILIFKKEKNKKLSLLKGLSRIRAIEYKLASMEARLNSTITNGLMRIAELKEKGMNMDAEILAAELSSRRQMLMEISKMRTGLERLRMRLETIMIIGESRESIRQLKQILGEIKNSGFEKIPELSIMFGELEEIINGIEEEFDISSIDSIDDVTVVSSPAEVERILKEADIIAQGREKRKLPVPPGS